jgi:hypothetical protein
MDRLERLGSVLLDQAHYLLDVLFGLGLAF